MKAIKAIKAWLIRSSPVVLFFKRPYRFAVVFAILLTAAFAFTLLDTFVLPKTLQAVQQDEVQYPLFVSEQTKLADSNSSVAGQKANGESTETIAPVITANSYKDENIEISIETIRVYDTDVYIADIRISSIDYFKTAFAQNIFGRNINEKTSVIAAGQNAILAINGDYYGFRNDGWVLRNGILYRSEKNPNKSVDAFLMDREGSFSYIEGNASIEGQLSELWQIWSFGPALVVDGEISVTKNQEIQGRSSNSNPRTAMGQLGDLHYIFIVSDGRTNTSAGLSLFELASLLKERGCLIAYNLDGGGSSTMFFNGQIVNNPTTDGKRIKEREISDIVYIGY